MRLTTTETSASTGGRLSVAKNNREARWDSDSRVVRSMMAEVIVPRSAPTANSTDRTIGNDVRNRAGRMIFAANSSKPSTETESVETPTATINEGCDSRPSSEAVVGSSVTAR